MIKKAILAFWEIYHKRPQNNAKNMLVQFVKFGIVGVSNTVLSYIIYVVTLILLKKFQLFTSIDYLVAQAIMFVLSVLWSFYWNNRFVFSLGDGEKRSIWKSLLKTYITYSFTGLFLNSILLVLWIETFNISEYVAPIFNLAISVPVNFFISKYWAYRKK